MTRWKLSKIYAMVGAKHKSVIKKAGNPRKYNEELVEELTAKVRRDLLRLNEEGYEIFAGDESLFSAQSFKPRAWSKRK